MTELVNNAKQTFGKAILAASTFVAAADNSAVARRETATTKESPPAVTSKQETQDGKESYGSLSLPQEHAQDGVKGGAENDDRRKKEDGRATDNRARVKLCIETMMGLIDKERRLETATFMNDHAIELLSDEKFGVLLSSAVVEFSRDWIDHEPKLTNLIESPAVADAMYKLLNTTDSKKLGKTRCAKLYDALPPERRTRELSDAMRLNSLAYLEICLSRAFVTQQSVADDLVPKGLLSADDARTLIKTHRTGFDALTKQEKIDVLKCFNMDPAATQSLMEELKLSPR